jgi:hypothetical protein
MGSTFTIDAQWSFASERAAKTALAAIDAELQPKLAGTEVEVHTTMATTYLHASELADTVTRAGAKARAGHMDVRDLDAGLLSRGRPGRPPVIIRPDPEIVATEPRGRIVHPEAISSFAWHGEHLATGGHPRFHNKNSKPDAPQWGSTVCVWHLPTGQRLGRFAEGDALRYLSFSPDGELLAVSRAFDQHHLELWQWRQERMIARFNAGGPVHWSPDGAHLATTRLLSRGSRGLLIDVAAGRVQHTFEDGAWALFYRDATSFLRQRLDPDSRNPVLELVDVSSGSVGWRKENVDCVVPNNAGAALLVGQRLDSDRPNRVAYEILDFATLETRATLRVDGTFERALATSTQGWIALERERATATRVLDDGTIAATAPVDPTAPPPTISGRSVASDGRSLVLGPSSYDKSYESQCRPTWADLFQS